MGNEMGNSNVSGLQEQEKTEPGSPNKYSEVSATANIRAETQPIFSAKEENLHEGKGLNSEDPSGIEASDETYPNETEVQVPGFPLKSNAANEETKPVSTSEDGCFVETASASEKISSATKDPEEKDLHETEVQVSDGVPLLPNDANEEAKPISSSEDGCFPETVSASENISSETKDYQAMSSRKEPGNSNVQALNGSSKDLSESNDTIEEDLPKSNDTIEDEIKLTLSPDDGCFHEKTLVSETNQSATSEHQIQEQTSTERVTGDYEVQDVEESLEALLVLNDTNDKQVHSDPLEPFDEDDSDSKRKPSETIYDQIQKQTSNETEGEDAEKSSLSAISTSKGPDTCESMEVTFNQQKLVNVHADVEDGCEMQRCNADNLRLDEPHDSEEEKNFYDSNSEREMKDHDLQLKQWESQEEKLPEHGNTNERKDENELESECGITVEAHVVDVEIDAKDAQLEVVPLKTPLESFELKASESKDKLEVLVNGMNSVEDNTNTLKPVPVSEGSVQELETDKITTSQFESVEMGKSLDNDREGTKVDRICNYRAETDTDSFTGETNITDNGNDDDFHGSEDNSMLKENSMDLEKQAKMVSELSTSPPDADSEEEKLEKCPSLSNSSVEPIPEKTDDLVTQRKEDEEEQEIIPFTSDPTETAQISGQTHLVSLDQTKSEVAKQNPFSPESEMQENMKSTNLESKQENFSDTDDIETFQFDSKTSMQFETSSFSTDHSQQQELIPRVTDSKDDLEFGSPDSNESYKTAMEHENFSPMVDARSDFSFQFHNPNAEYPVPPTHRVTRSTIGSNSDNLSETFSKAAVEESYQSPLLYSDVFELNGGDSEYRASKVDVGVHNLGRESEFTKAGEKHSGKQPSEDQMSAEKQVITLKRTDSQKSKIPLVSFLKDENYLVGSQQKQVGINAKKAVEAKLNSEANNAMATPPGREKRKPKTSFFSTCMCCTAVIQ